MPKQYKIKMGDTFAFVKPNCSKQTKVYEPKIGDAYNKFANERDKEYLKDAIAEMKRYVGRWSSLSAKQKRDISPLGLSDLKQQLKYAEDRLKQLRDSSTAPLNKTLMDSSDVIVERIIKKVSNSYGDSYWVVKGKFPNHPYTIFFVTRNNPTGKKVLTGGGSVEFSEQEAIKTANNYATMNYLDKKYGKVEGYKRWMRGETDSAIKDYRSDKDSYKLMEDIPLKARAEMKKPGAQPKAIILGYVGQMEDIIKSADPKIKSDLKQKALKILSDLNKQFNTGVTTLKDKCIKDAKKEYTINWQDTYHRTKDKTRVDANSVWEAVRKFGDIIALGGIGTANCYIVNISPNDGWLRTYGKLSDLLKQHKNDTCIKDESLKVKAVKGPVGVKGWKIKSGGKTYIVQNYAAVGNTDKYEIVELETKKRLMENASASQVKQYAKENWDAKLLDASKTTTISIVVPKKLNYTPASLMIRYAKQKNAQTMNSRYGNTLIKLEGKWWAYDKLSESSVDSDNVKVNLTLIQTDTNGMPIKDRTIKDKLIQSSSKEAFDKNVATEIRAGKSKEQALAIAYDIQRKNKDNSVVVKDTNESQVRKKLEKLQKDYNEVHYRMGYMKNTANIAAANNVLDRINAEMDKLLQMLKRGSI